jgi:hypothetical protein
MGPRKMATVQFLGNIYPPGVNLSTIGIPAVIWKDDQLGQEVAFTIYIENSDVRVECKMNDYQSYMFAELYRRSLDLAKGMVSLWGFASGYGLTVTLNSFIDPQQNREQFVIRTANLEGICTAYSLTESPPGNCLAVLKIVLSDPSLFMALSDLMNAIIQPNQGPSDAARAIERIRHSIAPGLREDQAWPIMRQHLQIDLDYLKYITDISKGPRHGEPKHTPSSTAAEAVRRAWVIMNRYLEYRKRGSTPLPDSEFPKLTA